ncbi:hypothetical protein Q7P35_000478 [Cladosporium inversicolor]
MRAAAREMMPPRLHRLAVRADELLLLLRRPTPDVVQYSTLGTHARSLAISPSNTSTRRMSRCHGGACAALTFPYSTCYCLPPIILSG